MSTTSDSPLFFLPLELSLRAPYVTQAPTFEREKRDRNLALVDVVGIPALGPF